MHVVTLLSLLHAAMSLGSELNDIGPGNAEEGVEGTGDEKRWGLHSIFFPFRGEGGGARESREDTFLKRVDEIEIRNFGIGNAFFDPGAMSLISREGRIWTTFIDALTPLTCSGLLVVLFELAIIGRIRLSWIGDSGCRLLFSFSITSCLIASLH